MSNEEVLSAPLAGLSSLGATDAIVWIEALHAEQEQAAKEKPL
jgi:hypothetical protein